MIVTQNPSLLMGQLMSADVADFSRIHGPPDISSEYFLVQSNFCPWKTCREIKYLKQAPRRLVNGWDTKSCPMEHKQSSATPERHSNGTGRCVEDHIQV